MLNIGRYQHGVSLAELLVGVTIVAILAGIAAPSFKSWTQNTQLRAAAESISDGLQLARTEAVRRNASVQFILSGTHSGWSVGCAVYVPDLDADGLADCPTDMQSRSATEGTANAAVVADNTAVTFNGLGRASNVMTINITNPTGGACVANGGTMNCLRVTVVTGGRIRMCDPALPSTNPQGC